ncbi:MAG: HAD family phosphatase [Lachnospiraceae bacterium]|jgi:beta-phosphoglucomutase-like phosphatase (HAD superfamily)|nr:HAD family phosphatase [Lachnospiraceae bacterium]
MKHIMFEPEIYQYTMKKMKADPKKCLVVEDSTYGITAAKAAGAIVIGREDERFGYDQSGADYLIKRLTEIVKIIEGGVS